MRHNIYIRQEDESAWQKIEDKPLFLHNALQIKEVLQEEKPQIQLKEEKSAWTCKHGGPGFLCKSEGCVIESRKHG